MAHFFRLVNLMDYMRSARQDTSIFIRECLPPEMSIGSSHVLFPPGRFIHVLSLINCYSGHKYIHYLVCKMPPDAF